VQAALSPRIGAAKRSRVTATRPRIAAFADRWPKSLALLLGAVSATGFAPLNLWPLTLLALAGWMALVARSPRGRRALDSGTISVLTALRAPVIRSRASVTVSMKVLT
jgi:apolipoprotein N-acyltransferase